MLRSEFALSSRSKYVIVIGIAIATAIAIGIAGSINPMFILLGVAVLFLSMVFLKWPDFVVIFVGFVIYTNAATVLIRFHGVPEILGYALPALLFIPFARSLVVLNQKIKTNVVLALMMVFLSIIIFSSVFSRDMNLAIPNVINFVAEGLGLYFLLINTIRTPELLRKVIWSLLIAGALIGGLTLLKQLTGNFDNNYGGFAQVTGVGFITDETIVGETRQLRHSGSIGEQNRYAQIMLMLVPLGLFQAWGERSKSLRLTAYILTGLIFIGGSLAFSRGAQVASLLLIIIMTILRYIKVHHLLIVLIGLILFLQAFPQINQRFSTLAGIFSSSGEGGLSNADSSIQGRATEMLAALYVFMDHPVIGVGLGMFRYEMEEYSKVVGLKNIAKTREAHSLYPGVAAETGILGFVTLMGIFLYTLYRLVVARNYWLKRNQTNLANLCTSFFLSIISYLITGLFLHMSFIRFIWLMIALAIVASEFREVDSTDDGFGHDTTERLASARFSLNDYEH